jgi:G3E family GTPase
VVVVNKGDLVTVEQKTDIIAKINLLNPRAKVVESIQSKVDVMEILNTHMFKAEDNKMEFWMAASKVATEKVEAVLECCETSMAKDGKKCCKSKSKDGRLVDSGLSQVDMMTCQMPFDFFTPRSSWTWLPTTTTRSAR